MLKRFRIWFVEGLIIEVEVVRYLWSYRDESNGSLQRFIDECSRYLIFGLWFVLYVLAPVITALVFLDVI